MVDVTTFIDFGGYLYHLLSSGHLKNRSLFIVIFDQVIECFVYVDHLGTLFLSWCNRVRIFWMSVHQPIFIHIPLLIYSKISINFQLSL